jgi:RimJ/RimL family protein N-acetyltransferase
MIYGERIRLRGVEKEDLPKFIAWLNDPEVVDGLGMFLPLSSGDENKWYEGVASLEPAEKPLVIEVRDGDGWRLVGNSSFMGFEWKNRLAEVGLFIGDKSIWDKGYGTEVMLLLFKHGFETLNLNRIWLRVHDDNPRAVRVYEKVGMTHEGCYRQGVYKKGVFVDVLIMSILKSEWDALRAKQGDL